MLWDEEKALMLLRIYEKYIESGYNRMQFTTQDWNSGGRVSNKYILDRLVADNYLEYLETYNPPLYKLSEKAIRMIESTDMDVDKMTAAISHT